MRLSVAGLALSTCLLAPGAHAQERPTEEVVPLGPAPGEQWERHCPFGTHHDVSTGRCVAGGGGDEEPAPPPGAAPSSGPSILLIGGITLTVLGLVGGVISVAATASSVDGADGLGVAGIVTSGLATLIGIPLTIVGLSQRGGGAAPAAPPAPRAAVWIGPASLAFGGSF